MEFEMCKLTVEIEWEGLGRKDPDSDLGECLNYAAGLAVFRKYEPPCSADILWKGQKRGSLKIDKVEDIKKRQELSERDASRLADEILELRALRPQVVALRDELESIRQSSQQQNLAVETQNQEEKI